MLSELARELEAELDAHVARIVLEETLGLSAGALVLEGEREVASERTASARAVAARLREGEPLQYVLGHWSFRGLDLLVDHRALIPRPETELIVDHAFGLLDAVHADAASALVLDLGTGSGAIGLALCAERTGIEVLCSDVSPAALSLCAENASRLAPEVRARVSWRLGNLYEAVPAVLHHRVHVVVSNPPYLSDAEWLAAPPEVRDHEPAEALRAGPVGTELLAAVIAGAPGVLAPGGGLVVEIGWLQGPAALGLAAAAGASSAAVRRDLLGRDRFLVARF